MPTVRLFNYIELICETLLVDTNNGAVPALGKYLNIEMSRPPNKFTIEYPMSYKSHPFGICLAIHTREIEFYFQ